MIRPTNDDGIHDLSNKIWTKLDVEVIGPPILLLTLLSVASIGPIASIFSLMIALPVILYKVFRNYSDKNKLKQTKFFISWSVSSLIILISVFELEVVPYLEILFIENLLLISLTSLTVVLVIFLRRHQIVSELQINIEQNSYNCWIALSVPQRLYSIYLLSVVLVTIALIYGSQLTLTTICHSKIIYSVLLPDDCSEVYTDSDIKWCFVCAIYSLQIAVCLIFSLLKRFLTNGNKSTVKYIKLNRIDS